MNIPSNKRSLILLLAVLIPLAGLFVLNLLRSGPLAPVPVTVAPVERRSLTPVMFGIGTVEARFRYRIGPTRTGRLAGLSVDVGDEVKAGQRLGEMDAVDLDARIEAQRSTLRALESAMAMARARVTEAEAQLVYAEAQHKRFRAALLARAVSEQETESAERNHRSTEASLLSAKAALEAATREMIAARATGEALERQKAELELIAPVDGLIVERRIDPGSTAVAGEPVVEMIDPKQLWIHLRLNQIDAAGLRPGLACRIELRSRPGDSFPGNILRVEPLADAVTEELLAKVVFDTPPNPSPPIGELAEVHVELSPEPATPVVPAAAIKRYQGHLGIWLIDGDHGPRFIPVRTGRRSAEGMIQILEGLQANEPDESGDVIVHHDRQIGPRTRIEIAQTLTGSSR